MPQFKVAVTDYSFDNLDPERETLAAVDCEIVEGQCKTEDEVLALCRDADAILAQWAPVSKKVIDGLQNCKVIVRYGIGVDNVDLQAAKERGIPVCNVPDYGIDEVADHAVSMALCLGRQLPQIHARTLTGEWKLAPVSPMPAFREMTFGTAGFGRIAREVHKRVAPFGFRRIAFDPYVVEAEYSTIGVEKVELDELIAQSDILSLHSPLTEETRHLINSERLQQMKATAILVNTARGPLIDTLALAQALDNGEIAYAGMDVFEAEPLPDNHPLRKPANTLLTSHVAWYSESSLPKLQKLAAEEVVRALRNETLRNVVNL